MMHQSRRYLSGVAYVVGIVLWVPSAPAADAKLPTTQPAIETRPAEASKPTLAVLDFAVSGKVDPTGSKVVAASVRKEFGESGRYVLMDRNMMLQRMTEKDFAATAECDQVKCLVKYGKTLAVEKMVGGQISSFGESWAVAMHLVDVNTSQEEKYFFRKFTGKMDDIVEVAAEGARELLGLGPNSRRATGSRSAAVDPTKTMTLDLGGGVKMELVLIPAGEFLMGSPDNEKVRTEGGTPQHRVKITKVFYLGKYEVTQAQWRAVMGTSPSFFTGDNRPVEQVSWNDCQTFCQQVSTKTGRTVRLPTEAQWEYVCRAGATTQYYFGDSVSQLGQYAWYGGNSGNSGSQTHDAGGKLPNAFGLYDMHGNVWEWCQDLYGAYSAGSQTDPTGPSSGSGRVLRGGSWDYYAFYAGCAYRYHDGYPGHRINISGFRVALDSP
jgi:formylglycine-generating enzyme required for sulfatase activity